MKTCTAACLLLIGCQASLTLASPLRDQIVFSGHDRGEDISRLRPADNDGEQHDFNVLHHLSG